MNYKKTTLQGCYDSYIQPFALMLVITKNVLYVGDMLHAYCFTEITIRTSKKSRKIPKSDSLSACIIRQIGTHLSLAAIASLVPTVWAHHAQVMLIGKEAIPTLLMNSTHTQMG